MIIYSLFFYIFATLLTISYLIVITVRNPVHSVLWLIFSFFNAAGLFILLGAEFLAMTLVIVYVGAVAVLFLFVVMMLNIKIAKLKEGFNKQLPICISIALLLMLDLYLAIKKSAILKEQMKVDLPFTDFANLTNVHAIGSVLYTKYMPIFIISGLVLLVAMISAIVLTHRQRENVRKQNAMDQYAREDSIEIVKVAIGKGVS
jgi:NADH-quinone oxidoreductase subunit J